MRVELTGEKNTYLKKGFVLSAVQFIQKALEKKGHVFSSDSSLLVIACISEDAMKKLNHQFRDKNQVTDVLSFAPIEKEGLGELALCIPQIEAQASSHGLTVEEEAFYLILHGILHLLGYDHERGGQEAKKMYRIQDEVFEEWQNKRTS